MNLIEETSIRNQFGRLLVVAHPENKPNYRMLLSNGFEMGGLDLNDPDRLYHYFKIISDVVSAANLQTLFMIGHGVGLLGRHFHKEGRNISIVDNDRAVIDLSKTYFKYDGPEVGSVDGNLALSSYLYNSLDAVILDAFIGAEVPKIFQTKLFFLKVFDRLTDNGLFIMNYIGKAVDVDPATAQLVKAIKSIFPFVVYYEQPRVDSEALRNYVFVAGKRRITSSIETDWLKCE